MSHDGWRGVPRHVAIIMDGNGRWARQQGKPRQAGHKAGAESVRAVIEESVTAGIEVLTLFAFSSENWSRPEKEVSFLMDLFLRALTREVKLLQEQGIRFRVIGNRSNLSSKLVDTIVAAEKRTAGNSGMVLQLAVSYGGRWDIVQAAQKTARLVADGQLSADDIDENSFSQQLSFSDLPEVDLFIRTGGELRISNFILWQAAYAEFYFSDTLWPDFSADSLRLALNDYANRERRFGRTSEQLGVKNAKA
ncbi:polyprenyl diphosphate synthase [Solemya velum gill symbiont]|uniref:Ditrans,polycis-undecaprenyl-diphosphate synthase ((2E,6E)-farnesyl-diphosphate specific) n=1 Tax=Solemya velum gill symbiont TaxID=2340 RepID=A0A1T2J2G8_SOVGS|nr:polyprenyl diphosphate synthase [Solemya velum gill symbiont]OOY35878.1 di-trans,poly-cis-decaprenylcistransferase [Solemya velum gill symbiont]OOY38718.1 di-trans,poly-cis-decaprenylcistransferase [Solemya velum gill symbiont]OOY39071.1 di-trans,poly-cis-decaprenylcistransferase [Solemya velum gill symbiont]OOY41571.1 di-trans,poly-cis-decaprenylcistransferase [Solemya velum gill symbiont]OOY47521.1 di-trans,poly-cis-decaprenylcistransferase [Solemya velum gill symbiont]